MAVGLVGRSMSPRTRRRNGSARFGVNVFVFEGLAMLHDDFDVCVLF
jgi:hypothetical protein